MDSYSKDTHLEDKDFSPDLRNDELSSMEESQEQSQPRFGVEEPLEVQLRFDLGSFVDAQVLLDTHEPRESHWDFMRQEQGSEETTSLLAHVKQDEMKSFDNCEGWPRSSSQMDTQLFIDSQDDVSMITDVFGPKDKNTVDLVEHERGPLLTSYRHHDEATAWIDAGGKGQLKEKAPGDDNICKEDGAYCQLNEREIMETSQPLVGRPDTRDACEAIRISAEFNSPNPDNAQAQTNENKESQETEVPPLSKTDLMMEPPLDSEQNGSEDKSASVTETPNEPGLQGQLNALEGARGLQEPSLDCSEKTQTEVGKVETPNNDVIETFAEQTGPEVDTLAEKLSRQVGPTLDTQDLHFEEESKMFSFTEIKVDNVIPHANPGIHSEADMPSARPESVERDNEVVQAMIKATQDVQETETETAACSHVTANYTSPSSEGETLDVMPDSVETKSASGPPCPEFDSTLQGLEGVTTTGLPVLASPEEQGISNQSKVFHNEDIDGMHIGSEVEPCELSGKAGEVEGKTGEALEPQRQATDEAVVVEQAETDLAGDKGVAEMELLTSEQKVQCSESALSEGNGCLSKQGATDVCIGVENVESTTRCNDKKQEARNPDSDTDAVSSGVLPGVMPNTFSGEAPCEGSTENLVETPQLSTGPDDGSRPSDHSVPKSKDRAEHDAKDDTNLEQEGRQRDGFSEHDAKDDTNLEQEDRQRDGFSDALTAKDSSLGDEALKRQDEAQCHDESSLQGTSKELFTDGNGRQVGGDHSVADSPVTTAKPDLSDKDSILSVEQENTQSGGGLHVLLDVHKEAASGDPVLNKASEQDQPKDIESKGSEERNVLTDMQTINTGDTITRQSDITEEVTMGLPVTNVSGLTTTAMSGSHEQLASSVIPNVATPQEKASKRKSDAATRNNRLKDSARASPLQEPKSAGKEGFGRRKTASKVSSQNKGTDALEGYVTPRKSGSKSASGHHRKRKGISSLILQDGRASTMAQEGFQTPPNLNKTAVSMNARQQQHSLPDLNVAEAVLPTVLPVQPFSEPQQVQLRAQILVYGSLIQGVAPEEALMAAAFSNVTGAPRQEAARDLEGSGRALWEKQWQAAVERIRTQSSLNTPRDPTHSTGFLASGLPTASAARASEGGPRASSSLGPAVGTVDAWNISVSHARLPDIPGSKGHSSRLRQSAESGSGKSASRSNQSAAVNLPPVPSTSMMIRSIPSPLGESYVAQSSKPLVDLQQTTARTYFPTPSLGPFLPGAPQWVSPPSFSGPWLSQTQAAVYNTPSALFTHAQAVVSSDLTPEKAAARRHTSPSSRPVVPVSSIAPALSTPVVGSLSVTPTAMADTVQKRQTASEFRARKRKKTQPEPLGFPVDGVSNTHLAVGTASHVGNQTTSSPNVPIWSSGQAGSVTSSPFILPSFTSPESLAMVVANTQVPRTFSETSMVSLPSDKVPIPSPANMLSDAPNPMAEHWLEKYINSQNLTSKLEQAKASAEEASSVAASAVRESEYMWSQLKAQISSGLTQDREIHLVASVIAMTTAVSVAKAAAAAARAAYEAAIQAKMMREDALGSSEQANADQSSRLLKDKADNNVSQTWQMPENCNSTMAAARMASRKRLEAASAARMRAQNFDSVVRAAELASNAVSQVGAVMAMGDSVPFSLEMLMEAGPEGLHTLLSPDPLQDKDKANPKGTGAQTPGKKSTVKKKDPEETEKTLFKKSTSDLKEIPILKEAHVDNRTTEPATLLGSEKDDAEPGIGLMADSSKTRTRDHVAVDTQTSKEGTPSIEIEGVFRMEPTNQIVKDSLVEVLSDEKGLRGVWFSAKVQNVEGGKVLVLYDELLSDDGSSPLQEWIHLEGSSSKAPRVRLAHPNTNIGFEGTRKRRREAMGNFKWSVGDRVDALIRDGWWEGEIKEVVEDGESKVKVFFPGEGDTSLIKTSKLRPSLMWSNGQWALWTDTKQENNVPLRVSNDTHEGETPIAKRQKTEKILASTSNVLKQKALGASTVEKAPTHKEGSHLDSAAAKLHKDGKGTAVDEADKSKQQGPKVVFGVPKPTKKRKFIEVSKHYVSSRGARGTLDVKATREHEDPAIATLEFHMGSTEGSKSDGSKAKKNVPSSQKARVHKGAEGVEIAQTKSSASRNQKEKPFSDTKNPEGKLMRKKVPSDGGQMESQKLPEVIPTGEATVQKVAPPTTAAIFKNLNEKPSSVLVKEKPSSVLVKESGKEPSYPVKQIEKSAKETEKQTSHPIKESERESSNSVQEKEKQPSHQVQEREKPSHPVKETEQQPHHPVKENEKQSSHSAKASGKPSRPVKKSKKQSSQPVNESEKRAHPMKESQKQPSNPVKENEKPSERVKESEKQPLNPGMEKEKQPSNPVKGSEKQPSQLTKENDKVKDIGKSGSEIWEPRRTSRKIQPTSKLLEGLQTAPKLGKSSSSHERASRPALKGSTSTVKGPPSPQKQIFRL